jgi:adenylate cyclase
VGYRRWNKNPTVCNRCFRHLPEGGIETDVAVMFADLRGSTALAETLSPTAFADILNRFYGLAIDVLAPHRAIIDKMIGDEVMAFVTAMVSHDHRASAIAASVELMRRFLEVLPAEEVPRLGIGLHAGPAFVGKVGSEELEDLKTLGDTVNIAARLQAEAGIGEILLSEDLYRSAVRRFPFADRRVLSLRGREAPIAVRILRP